jgi:hypothetical protein
LAVGLATAAGLVAVEGASAGAVTVGGGADNLVIVGDTAGQPPMERASIQIAYDPAQTVANQNVAVARSTDCNGCRSLAGAVQFVLVEGSPTDVQPTNAATAANSGCDACASYAYARQTLIWTSGMAHLSAGAMSQLQGLESQMDQDLTSYETQANDPAQLSALSAALDALSAEAETVVVSDLQASGQPATAGNSAVQTENS